LVITFEKGAVRVKQKGLTRRRKLGERFGVEKEGGYNLAQEVLFNARGFRKRNSRP